MEDLSISSGVSEDTKEVFERFGRKLAKLLEDSYYVSCIEYECECAT